MGEILSHSEVEAILAAIDFSLPVQATTPAPAITTNSQGGAEESSAALYDFEHPSPLRPAQLGSLSLAAAATCQSLQSGLTSVLHAQATVAFLGVEQSTYRDYLETSEKPGCLAVFRSSNRAGHWLLDLSRAMAFTIVNCQLGGLPVMTNPASLQRPFTEVEIRLLEKAMLIVLRDLSVGLSEGCSLQLARIVSDGALLEEATSNEAVALISFEVCCGAIQGLMQLCLPWQQANSSLPAIPLTQGESREIMTSGAVKLPITATARIAHFKLTTRELASLSPGDILLTDASPDADMSLAVDGREIFRGLPGQSHDHKVIRLTVPVVQGRPIRSSEQ